MKNTLLIIAALFLLIRMTYSQNAPEIFVQSGHPNLCSVYSLAISSDNRFLVSADDHWKGSNLIIWDLEAKREFRTLKIDGDDIWLYYHLRFSPDNTRLLVLAKSRIIIFNIITGDVERKIEIGEISFDERYDTDKILEKYYLTSFVKQDYLPISFYKAGEITPGDFLISKKDNKVYSFSKISEASGYEALEYRFESFLPDKKSRLLNISISGKAFTPYMIDNVNQYGKYYLNNAIISKDYKYFITAITEDSYPIVTVWDTVTGKKSFEFGKKGKSRPSLICNPYNRYIYNFDFGDNSHTVIWDTQIGEAAYIYTKEEAKILKDDPIYQSLIKEKLVKNEKGVLIGGFESTSTDDKFVARLDQGRLSMRLFDKASDTEIAEFYSFPDKEWIVITPEGYFNASPNGAKYINVRIGSQVYSIDNFYEKYYDPAYVASVLQGSKVQPVADIRQGVAMPPEVKITSPETNSEFKNEEVTITISAKDMGGGINEIRLYHNGKAVGDDTRGIKIAPKISGIVKSFTVTMIDGKNTFRAVGFSSDRTESNPSEIIINLLAPEKDISLFVLSVGINEYKNPALNLNYAEPDAKAIADFFRQNSDNLFRKTEIIDIYNSQATKAEILSKLKELQNTEPQDVVLIYLAGHGESINEKWYFIPHELTYPEREEDVIAKAISSDELSTSIKNIKAQKVLVLIDACKSGAVLLAFRGFEDRKALSQLSRATGVHVVAASSKDQFAAEVKDLGHGVFTYTLLEGLNGRAAQKGQAVTVRKLMGYIEEQLPEITKRYRQEAQYPVVDSKGMDFPLVKGK